MNRAERSAVMYAAFKMMADVVQEARAELQAEGQPFNSLAVWERCGMPTATHNAQLLQFIEKQQMEITATDVRNRPFRAIENRT